MAGYSVIGKRVPRVDARLKVTGGAKYAADFELPGMLWGKLLGSPYPHARILNIDTSRAERLPGVKAVITAKDFGGYRQGYRDTQKDDFPLAEDKVRYWGEPVAAVAAIDEDVAEEACDLIRVDYEELPGIFDPEEAMREGAPQIHNWAKNNICVEKHFNFGDVEKGFSESYLVREDRFRTGRVTHGYLEPPAILAYYEPPGSVTLWAAKGTPHRLLTPIAECFRLPLSSVRIIQPFVGGVFGGTKNSAIEGDFCAVMLSKKTGRPVKVVYSQEQDLVTCRRRHSMTIDIKTGVKKDGTLVATQVQVMADGGPVLYNSPNTMFLAGIIHTLPYKLPNFKYDAYCVYTNNPISGAMRGQGVSHTRFAAEVQMDMIAEELRIDPVELRLRNAIEAPYETINKINVESCGMTEALEKVAEDPLWRERSKRGKREESLSRGVGISCSSYLSGAKTIQLPLSQCLDPSSVGKMFHQSCGAIIQVCQDGMVNLMTGATDIGTGSDTVLCHIVAEEFGIGLDDVVIRRVDTAYTPVDPGSWGSRVTMLAGQATQKASADAKRQLLECAAEVWSVKPEDIEIRNGEVFVKSDPEKSMPFKALARIANLAGGGAVIIGRGYSTFALSMPDFDKGEGNPGEAYSFTAQSAEVKVDMETGQIWCTDMTIAHDCGMPINPMTAESQNEGGAVQGLGQVLYEDLIMEKGKTLNPTFLDYKMARSTDVPNIKVIDIITNDPHGLFGAKEAGEGSIVSSPPAVVSAIHAATGVWFKELPITPGKVVKALKESGKRERH